MRPASARILRVALLGLTLASVGGVAGCGEDAPVAQAPRPAVSTMHGNGVVTGKITFSGPAPTPRVVRNQPCCPGAPDTLTDESVVVNPDGTLANVVVYLDGGPKLDGAALPPALLDQKFCQYRPHVVGIVVNQELDVRSSDATFHNVSMSTDAGDARNFSMQRPGETVKTKFTRAGFVHSECNVHSWMKATVAVMDNPLFAITGPDGTFRIENVPAGHYTLVAWQEQYQFLKQSIDVTDTPLTVELGYHPPTP